MKEQQVSVTAVTFGNALMSKRLVISLCQFGFGAYRSQKLSDTECVHLPSACSALEMHAALDAV